MHLGILQRIMVMKFVALLVACVLCGPAIAQTNDCQSIAKASERLACYDKAAPPISRSKPAPAPAPVAPPADPLAAENARLDAKINNICRGC
jgi:hypothetical protein